MWRGGNLAFTSGLPDEGILVLQLALAQGKMYFPSFCGLGSSTAQPHSLRIFLIPAAQNKTSLTLRPGNIKTRNLGPS